MTFIALIVIGLILLGAIAFVRLPLIVWTVLFGGLIALTGWIPLLIFAVVMLPLNIPVIRQVLLTKPLFKWFKNNMPPMSQTEKEAIDAGNVGWEKYLFQGAPDWKHCMSLPKVTLRKEETDFLMNQVETICQMLNDWEIVHEQSNLPAHVWDYLKKEKFFGMIIPKRYGGLEFSVAGHSAVIVKLATRSITGAVTAMVPNSLGPAELLLHYGTNAQKEFYLPKLAVGEEIPCFALTGPEAGSDAGNIPDKGIICKDMFNGEEVIGIRLTFDKRYITLAPVATVLGVAFQLFDPDYLIGDQAEIGVTLCLIPMNHPGIEGGNRHYPLGLGLMNGPIRAKDIFIPMDWIIGGQHRAGQGWRMLMECLSAGRGISLPALSTGTSILTYKTTGAYSAIRRQFNMSLNQFEGVEESLAEIAGATYLLESTRLFTIASIEQYQRPAVTTAIAKYHMTEITRKTINHGMDVHAGRGIMMGPSNYIARWYQAVPMSITVEGANILTRCLMIYGQGIMRCHPFIKDEIGSLSIYDKDPIKAVSVFDDLFMKHGGYFISNLMRTIIYSLTRGNLSFTDKKIIAPAKHFVKKMNWLSAALAFTTDVSLMILGGSLKRKERLSGRLGDVLSQLYLASAVVKYHSDQNYPDTDNAVVKWVLQNRLYLAQEAFYEFFNNFPNVFVGTLLKWIIFPFGRAFTPPHDRLSHEITQSMVTSNPLRERLTELCFVGKEASDPTGNLENTFIMLPKIQIAMEKMSKALRKKEISKQLSFEEQIQEAVNKKIINVLEAELYQSYENLRKQVISVDEFTPSYALGTEHYVKTIQ